MIKKCLKGLLLSAIMCFAITGCGKLKIITLDEIVEKFNNSETVKQYKEYGFEMKASAKDNKLTITSIMGEEDSSVSYNLNDNILSNENLADEDLMSAIVLIDSIGQMRGYKDGELAENMNAFADEIKKYTLDKEGFELKTNEESNSIKIDLSKKIPLIDLKDFYLKPDTFDMIKEFVEEKTTGNQSGKLAKLAYDVSLGVDESNIYIGEKDKLTDSSYKSILSALEVMYGTETVNKFKEAYPSFKDGKTTVEGFTIETNYEIEDQEESMFKDMKVVLVTINNEVIK